MIKFKSFTVQGIGRFVDPQAIDLSSLGNLVQVDGENRNTGGSSGAGKSTLFNAIDYLFGVNDIPNSVLQSRLTKEAIEVKGEFEIDGVPLTIKRGKSAGLVIDLGGDITSGNAKLSEEKLDSILSMPRDLFRKLLHKRQQEGGFFLDMTPKEMNDFLANTLDLAEQKFRLTIADTKAKELAEAKTTVDNALENNRSALKATQDAILSLGLAPIRDMHPEVVAALRDKAEKSMLAAKTVQDQHKAEIKQVESERPAYEPLYFDRTTVKRLEDGIATLDKKRTDLLLAEIHRQTAASQRVAALKNEERDRKNSLSMQVSLLEREKLVAGSAVLAGEDATKEALTLATDIKKIREAICPTCEQTWVTATAKTKEQEKVERLKSLRELVENGKKSLLKIAEIEKEISSLQLRLAEPPNPEIKLAEAEALPKAVEGIVDLDNALSRLKDLAQKEKINEAGFNAEERRRETQLLEGHNLRLNDVRSRQHKEMELARGQAEIDLRVYENARSKLNTYEELAKRYDESRNRLVAQEKLYEEKVDLYASKLQKIESELILAEESKRAIKSFISRSFDEALETISENATNMIRNIPNMANATIRLEGLKENKDGKVKEEVTAYIDKDGEINIPIKSLSGGERSAVDIAIDLSVIDLIEQRTGKGIDIFILDEPFTGLDTVCIENALEVLKSANLNKRLIIVDHNPEVKQMVQSRLVVVRDGLSSTVTQN